MALINNIYVLVEAEDIDNEVETVSHPTESGIPTSDTVRKQPVAVNLQGKIANTGNLTAKEAVKKIKALQNSGSLITYIGQAGTIQNLQIQSFNESYSYKNYGGADFTMSLKVIKIAKSAYVAPIKVEVTKTTFAEGDTVIFLGGNVYVASDATKPSANRGRSTCKLTKISDLANRKHIYHLISTDGRLVYGWVDESNVQGVNATTNNETNGGTQQVEMETKQWIYHTVKKNETVYRIVKKIYPSFNLSMTQIQEDNPHAFSNPKRVQTLQIGARLKCEVDARGKR